MKKLLINGCSFVAGDEVVWDQYLKSLGKDQDRSISWGTVSNSHNDIYQQYINDYRPKFNLGSKLIENLGWADKIDLSDDGSSNDMISIKTIAYLMSIPEKDRQQFHVCIGWTSVSRLMKYTKYANVYINLHVNHFGLKGNPTVDELSNYIRYSLVEAYDEDFAMNYVKNVILLESFLKANNITYTFFRSLGTQHDFKQDDFKPFNEYNPQNPHFAKDRISNISNWYSFLDKRDVNTYEPMYGISWCDSTVLRKPNMLLPNNGHPNMNAVLDLAKPLSNFIKNRQVL
jgi:hypothetical protein